MKILLVYPEFPDTFWSFKHALRFIQKKAVSPPLGLLTVAAMLPDEWIKRLVDLNVTNLTPKDLSWADYVFISAMIVQRDAIFTKPRHPCGNWQISSITARSTSNSPGAALIVATFAT